MQTSIMLLAFIAIMGILGFMNHRDVTSCIERGNSTATCERAFNR